MYSAVSLVTRNKSSNELLLDSQVKAKDRILYAKIAVVSMETIMNTKYALPKY